MKVKSLAELPETGTCRKCRGEKPRGEMVVVRLRKQGLFYMRPRCKSCQNEFERGHRREWKRAYLRRWRKWNHDLNESYWRQRNRDRRAELNAYSYRRFRRNHAAILVQGRLRRQAGMSVSLAEAKKLVAHYGMCYPTRFGLTKRGLRECERIRSSMRRLGKHLRPVEIRMMVYADGHFKQPRTQTQPYARASAQLRRWHRQQKATPA